MCIETVSNELIVLDIGMSIPQTGILLWGGRSFARVRIIAKKFIAREVKCYLSYVCMYVYMYVCTCMCICMYMCACVCVYMYVHVCVCVCVCICMYVCVYVCMYPGMLHENKCYQFKFFKKTSQTEKKKEKSVA